MKTLEDQQRDSGKIIAWAVVLFAIGMALYALYKVLEALFH